MQMKNQRFLYPESAAERKQAEDDPLVRSDGVDDVTVTVVLMEITLCDKVDAKMQ